MSLKNTHQSELPKNLIHKQVENLQYNNNWSMLSSSFLQWMLSTHLINQFLCSKRENDGEFKESQRDRDSQEKLPNKVTHPKASQDK